MDLRKIKRLFQSSLKIKPEQPSEANRIRANEIVGEEKTFKKLLANLNIDDLKYKRADFAKDDPIVRELDSVIEYVQRELNKDPLYMGHIEKVGSCTDDSRVDRVDEADTLYVLNKDVEIEPKTTDNSFEMKGIDSPSEFVSDFADCMERIMQKWRPTGALTHGGCLAPSFSGVRYNGPAVTALFVYNDGDKPLLLSLDVTPVFKVPIQLIPEKLCLNMDKLKKKQSDKIYDMTGIYLFPNIINDEWQLTSAHFEAKLFRDLPKRSPLKQAYNFVKIISHMINRANVESVFKKLLKLSSSSKNREKEILQALADQKFMRYGHLFLTKETAKSKNEIGKSAISINTTAMKHILLTEAFSNPELSGESSNIEDDVYKLVTKAFELFLEVKSGDVPHALLECNISIYSISKPSLMDGMGPLLQCVLMEEIKAIYNKINLHHSPDVNTVDCGTTILPHLRQYAVPVSELKDPRYHFRVPLDASITPRRNLRVTHIYQIISACANSCGGTISIPIDNREMIEDDTLTRWKKKMSQEIKKTFKDFAVQFNEQFDIEIEPSVHLIKVNINGDKSYQTQSDGFVVMTPIKEQSTDDTLGNTQGATTSRDQPESQESTVDADIQGATGGSEFPTSPEPTSERSPSIDQLKRTEPTSEGGPPIDQLKRTDILTWTKTSDWEKHLTVPQRDFLSNYELHSQTFQRTSPLCIYPCLSLLDGGLQDQVNALAESHKGHKGFLLWSRQLMTLFDPGCELPVPPEGHQLDVLCVWGEDSLTLDLCALQDDNSDLAEYQSYLAQTSRLLRFMMTHKLRWMTNKEEASISIPTYVCHQMPMCHTEEPVQVKQSTSKDIVQKQLASLSLLLLDKTHHTKFHVKVQDETLINLSYEQSRVVLQSKNYNFIEGPPGSGKSMVALYICETYKQMYGKDQTAFFCTTPAYKAYIEHQDKATVYLVQNDEDLEKYSKSLTQFKCVIVDDVHNLQCSKEAVNKFLEEIHKLKIAVFFFADCQYQNYKHSEYDIFCFRQFCGSKRIKENYQELTEVHRNTRTIASFLSASLRTENGDGDGQLICAHTIRGNDVIFRKTSNLLADNDDNGILRYVRTLIKSDKESLCTYTPNQIAILVDADDSMIQIVTNVVTTYLPNVDVHGAGEFPRTGIIVDSLDNFMGLESPVCIFPILNQLCKSNKTPQSQHNIFESKYKMFVASRAVHHMAFLMEEDFNSQMFAEMRMDNIQSWEPDYRHTGDPQTYDRLRGGEGEFAWPRSVAACPRTGRLVVTDVYNHRLHVLTGELRPVVTFGSRGRGDGEYSRPWGVTVTSAGDVYVTDWGLHRVQVHGLDGGYRRQFGSEGSGPGQYNTPRCITHHGDRLYVCDYNNRRVAVCDMEGRHITEITVPSRPQHIAVSRDGRQLAVSAGGDLYLMTTAGVVTRTLRPGQGDIVLASGVCYDGYGHLIVADRGAHCLRVLREDGSQVCEITAPGERDSVLGLEGVTMTADGNIAVCDYHNNCIHLYKVPGRS